MAVLANLHGPFTSFIQENREYLMEKWPSHRQSIQQAWVEMTVSERKAVLVQVDPEFYPHQWGQPLHNIENGEKQTPIALLMRKFRAFSLMPYLDLETLGEDSARLLGLLQHRTQHSPEDWAPYDSHNLRSGWDSGFYTTVSNPNCIIVQGPRYGEVVEWNAELAHSGEILGFPRAQLMLEAQTRLLAILRDVVDNSLQRNLATGSPAENCIVSELCFKDARSYEFTSNYLNQPFSATPAFDILKLLSIAQARRNAASDHVWLLQTDPSYMRHSIAIIREYENVPG
jgi:hypothetical protein